MNLSRYSDVTWASWCLKSWSTRLLFQQVAEAQQRKHQSSALYALMDPPVTRLVCCHTIMQFKSLTEKFDFKWRHIWNKSLKHRGRAKMADIFQTTFLKALYWMKMYKFRLRFHGSLFLGVPALVQIITWHRAPFPSGLRHWHCGNRSITPVPVKHPGLHGSNLNIPLLLSS